MGACIFFVIVVQKISRVRLFGDPMDCSPPDSFVHGISQATIHEGVAISSSRGFPDPGIEPMSSALQTDSLPSEPPGKPTSILILL